MNTKIRHNDIDINNEDPFSNCKLGRKQYAVVLTEIVKNFNDGFVLAINNEWGTGKTTFVKMWQKHLEKNTFKTLYFNAWENDFEKDILIALISELKELKTSKNEESYRKVINKAAPLAKSLALGLLKTQIEKHVGNDFVKELINQTTSTIADSLQEQIEAYTNRKNNIVEFKKSLRNFVSSTCENKPVIFIIDELDRCRPNYAVELLEQIKHLFSVSGIVFVLSIDKKQLGYAIRGVYGSDRINSDEYLRRFIDIEYSIPKPDIKIFTNYLYDYFQFDEFFSIEQRMQYPELTDDKSIFISFASSLFNYGNFTLRVQEKIFAHARLALCGFTSQSYVVPSLFILLIYLKLKHTSIYESIKNTTFSLQELIDNVESTLPTSINEKDITIYLYTLSMLIKSYNNTREYHLRENLVIDDKERSKIKLSIKSRIDRSEDNEELASFIDPSRRYFSNINDMNITHLIKKIDLTETIVVY